MKEKKPIQAGPAWRCIWIILLLLGLVAVMWLSKFSGVDQTSSVSRVITSVFLLLAWAAAIRFLMLDTWGRIFWLLILLGALALVFFLGTGGIVMGTAMSCFFLFSRLYHPWRLVPPRRRAIAFGLGALALVALFGSMGMWTGLPDEAELSVLDQLGIWALGSLLVFWFLSLFHLAVRMRLHFLRLRAKLAVNAVLIGFIPMVLMVVLGLYIFYSVMGGSRAVRSANILQEWTTLASSGNDLTGAPFDTTFSWPQPRESIPDPTQHGIPAPDWVEGIAGFLAADSTLVAIGDSTGYFLVEQDIWLMDWRDIGSKNFRTTAWLLNERPLIHLSGMVKAGVELTNFSGFLESSGININNDSNGSADDYEGIAVSYRDISGDHSYWNPWRSFGIFFFPVNNVTKDGIENANILLSLGFGWADWKADFLEGENNLNQIALFTIVLLAGLFFVIELFAIFFGVRITEGFVSAVHSLHKGTKALAGGDLDAYIDIPNEDEFGDLAGSFNEMTVAIRQGRKDALAKEALTLEMATAREIQERLLPSEEPTISGFEVTGTSIPSREVGGDYFDFILTRDHKLGIAIGDVSGKGMPAALLMSNLQASLHGQVIHPSSVSEVVGRVNDLIVASTDTHMFATFFYGLLDTVAGTFTSTNAGHNPPMVFRSDGRLETLNSGGLLLGMLSDMQYKQETITLDPGDVVVLYTDGITEAVGPGVDEDNVEAMFGEEALEEVIRNSCHLPAVGIKEAILEAVSTHTEGVAQSDDITLVVVRRQG